MRPASPHAGVVLRGTGKDGPQLVRTAGRRWSDEAEALFLDRLAASCNVTYAAEATGFSREAIYRRRRTDPAFAERWQAALEQGYARIEMALVRRAADALEGFAPDPDTPIPQMTVQDAIAVLKLHAPAVKGEARAVAGAAAAHGTVEIVAEANQGGRMVKAVLHTADPRLRVRLVHAHTGKSARAEPVSHLFEAGRAWLHGRMPELEAQMLGMIAGGGYEGPGTSPDRADAMVWGVSELMRERAEPRVRVV